MTASYLRFTTENVLFEIVTISLEKPFNHKENSAIDTKKCRIYRSVSISYSISADNINYNKFLFLINFHYYFRVPEIGEDLATETNPLIGENELPEFNNVTIEKCIGVIGNQAIAVEKGLKELEDSITEKTEVKDLFAEVFDPLEKIASPLDTTWGLAKTLYLGNSTLMVS